MSEISARQADLVVSKLAGMSGDKEQFQKPQAEGDSSVLLRLLRKRIAIAIAAGMIGVGLLIVAVSLWKERTWKQAQHLPTLVPIPSWEEHIKKLNKYGNDPEEIVKHPAILSPTQAAPPGLPNEDVELPERVKGFVDRFYTKPRLVEEAANSLDGKSRTLAKYYGLFKIKILKAQEANISDEMRRMVNPKHLFCIAFSAEILSSAEVPEKQRTPWHLLPLGPSNIGFRTVEGRSLGIYNVYVLMNQSQRIMGSELTNEDLVRGEYCPPEWSLLAPFPCEK